MMLKKAVTLLSFMSLHLFGAHEEGHITVVKVPQTKYNSNARLKITSPKVLKKKSPVLILVSNFPIGVDLKSQALDDLKVPINSAGSRVLLNFSNGQRIYVTKDDVNLLITQRSYFNKRFRINIPNDIYNSIENTNFVISGMLVNCYGEVIKNDNAYYADVYTYSSPNPGIESIEAAMKKPYIIYNEPFGTVNKQGILLDFFVRNATLAPGDYNVDLFIDGKKIVTIERWHPYVIQGLSPGKHTVRIELKDPSGNIVKSPVSVNSSVIFVK